MYELFITYDLPAHCNRQDNEIMHLVFINETNWKKGSVVCKTKDKTKILDFIEELKAEHWRIFSIMTTQELNQFLK